MMRSTVHPDDPYVEMANNIDVDDDDVDSGEDYTVLDLPPVEAADNQTAVNGIPGEGLREEWQAAGREGKNALEAFGRFGFRLGKAAGKSSLVAAKSALRQCKETAEKYNEKWQADAIKKAEEWGTHLARQLASGWEEIGHPDRLELPDAHAIASQRSEAMSVQEEFESAEPAAAGDADPVSTETLKTEAPTLIECDLSTASSPLSSFDSEGFRSSPPGSSRKISNLEAKEAPLKRAVATSSRPSPYRPQVPQPSSPFCSHLAFSAGNKGKGKEPLSTKVVPAYSRPLPSSSKSRIPQPRNVLSSPASISAGTTWESNEADKSRGHRPQETFSLEAEARAKQM
ncbi:uncharacterized protein EI97DRAFT_477937 [Westerdykella ornata]|uniref:Uncharacterized protein n=1 Tax=Westerdykella ornata TaxID=318751 RepID=A0A6A6JUC9_WESOR|nr:uncharacterized protein EI97DRAFT_477937 [Westerdykella ornata]KAF2280221.1 hypothetical protein EI97DRAFT_477937 [Westerdykella ornata]